MLAKMGLALYIGRYFALADIGIYGLVMGAVTMLTVVMGQDLIYVVSRDIVGATPATVLHKMRDQAVLYGLNYLALALVMGALIATHALDIAPRTMFYVLILAVFESFGAVSYANQNSLHQQVLANAMLFIRSGLWIVPTVALCMINPSFRNADTLFIGWIIGSGVSVAATLWTWRSLPWGEVMRRPIDWRWIGQGMRIGSLIWLGMMGLTAGTFVDRFIVEHYLSLEDVGVLTFYFSFTNALLTLVQSGVLAFATPRMIQHHRDNAPDTFREVAIRASRQTAIGSGIVALALGLFVPLLGFLLGRSAFVAGTSVFLMMLFATWLRANAEVKNNILFARHQDRAIWLGNLLFLIPALGGNLLLVPIFGLNGIGISALCASSFLLAWRWSHEHRYKRPAR